MKSILSIVFLSIILSGCPEKNTAQQNQIVELKTISKGQLFGAGEEGITKSNLVIDNLKDWETLVSKLEIANKVSENFQELPIDFSKEMVIACFDEVRNSGGYIVTIDSVKLDANKLKVVLSKKAPTGVATMVITQPYHIVKIEKTTNKEIVFVEQ